MGGYVVCRAEIQLYIGKTVLLVASYSLQVHVVREMAGASEGGEIARYGAGDIVIYIFSAVARRDQLINCTSKLLNVSVS